MKDTGLAVPGAVQALSEIIALVRAGVLPNSVSYSAVEEQMAQGKLAMIISGPWAWSNLIKSGIDFGVAPMPGVNGNLGRPFVASPWRTLTVRAPIRTWPRNLSNATC